MSGFFTFILHDPCFYLMFGWYYVVSKRKGGAGMENRKQNRQDIQMMLLAAIVGGFDGPVLFPLFSSKKR